MLVNVLALSPLLIKNSLRHLATHPWQTWLCIMGIMLGVAIIVAVDLANGSAQKAFNLSVDTLTSHASHRLTAGPMGLDEEIYARLRRELALPHVFPGISDQVSIKGHALTLVGIDGVAAFANRSVPGLASLIKDLRFETQGQGLVDFFSQKNSVVMSKGTAHRLQVTQGQSLSLNHRSSLHPIKVVGIFESGHPAASEGLILCDLATAQELLARLGRLDAIHLTLNQAQQQAVQHWLEQPGFEHLRLSSRAQQNRTLHQLSHAFHSNLTAMSFLAIMVGALLIYNCMSFSVLQRRRSLGILRNLGVSRREIFSLILLEAVCLGILGTLAGLALGLILGWGLLQLVLQTVNDLYFVQHVKGFFIGPLSLAKGAAVGLLVSCVAASIPAWEATHSQPMGVMERSHQEQKSRTRLPVWLLMGLVSMAAGWQLAAHEQPGLWWGFFALGLLALGYILAVPQMVLWLIEGVLVLKPLLNNMTRLILRGISSGISRSGLAIAALTLAVSVTIGVGVMVGSFRVAVASWLDQTLSGDIYVSLAGRSSARHHSGLPADLLRDINQLPGIGGVGTSRIIKLHSEYGLIRLMAVTQVLGQARQARMKGAVANFYQRFHAGAGILISEPLAYHQGIKLMDSIEIQTPAGNKKFVVLGIFYDYTSSQGLMIMPGHLYRQYWSDPGISMVSIYGQSPAQVPGLLSKIRRLAARHEMAILVRPSDEIRQRSLEIFERTFTVTQVLRLLAIIVAFMGILGSLMALQMARRKEFATLRAMGISGGQLGFMVCVQSLLMGVVAGLLAMPLGLLMSHILIEVINLRAFGWTMPVVYSGPVLYQALAISSLAALLAGLYPALTSARANIARALREE